MDDRKMKIKIVVRPEDEQKAAAADAARQARQKRGRWGIAALLALVAVSAAIALFFIGRGSGPGEREEPAVAAAPAGEEPRAGGGEGRSTADAAGVGAQPGGAANRSAADAAPPGQGHAPALPPAQDVPEAATDAAPQDPAGDAAAGTAAVSGAPTVGAEASKPSPGPSEPAPSEPAPSEPAPADGGPDAAASQLTAAVPAGPKPAPAGGGEAANAPLVAKAPAAKPGAGVVRAELASGVVNREPRGVLRSPVDVGAGGRTVFYFNEVRNLDGQTVAHRWEYDGRVMATIPMRIEGNRWRVYSSKRIGQNQLGDWRVSAVDKSGAVLAQMRFRAE